MACVQRSKVAGLEDRPGETARLADSMQHGLAAGDVGGFDGVGVGLCRAFV